MEEHGHYETVGDVQEWRWDEGHEPTVTVPKGEFSPLDPKPEPKKPATKTATKAEPKTTKEK